jgi:hypothetical protein
VTPEHEPPVLIDGDDLPWLINIALAVLFLVGVGIGWVAHAIYLAVTA